MTWLDEAVERAERHGYDNYDMQALRLEELRYLITPERFLALAEVVKAAERLHTCQEQDVAYRENQLGRVLARLEEL